MGIQWGQVLTIGLGIAAGLIIAGLVAGVVGRA
jgi:hypothetical protein